MTSRVLSIQSHVVSGYVGNKCAVFPLQVLGFEVDFVNSVQFSNHTGYGNWKGQVLNETDLDELYAGLKNNELTQYNRLLTGYVGSESFLRRIVQAVKDVKAQNPDCVYLCDPVLGDDGHFYVPESLIQIYIDVVLPTADIMTPNTFEIEHLTKMKVKTEEDVLKATEILHDIGVSIVVLTSLDSPDPALIQSYVSHRPQKGNKSRKVWKVASKKLSGKFTGSGDLFAALFLGWSTKYNNDLPKTLAATITTMGKVLQRTREFGEQQKAKHGPPKTSAPTELQLIQSIDDIRCPFRNETKHVEPVLVLSS